MPRVEDRSGSTKPYELNRPDIVGIILVIEDTLSL
jgi:hypothetical protein